MKFLLTVLFLMSIISSIAQPPNYSTPRIYVPVGRLPEDSVKRVMFLLLNELRKAKGLKPFKYDARLEAVAQSFVIEKNTTPWDEKKAHFDRYGHGPSYRLNKFGLLPPRDIFVEYGENVVETNHGWVSVFDMLSVLAGSPPHARWMFSPRITNAGFGYFHKSFLLIQEFLEVNKKFVSKIPETSDMKFLEKSLWEKACKTNDTLDYNFYLIYFPEGTHSKEVIPVKHDDND